MTTTEILTTCRNADRETPFGVVICYNDETLEDGYRDENGEAPDGLTDAMTDAAVRVIHDHPKAERVAYNFDRTFRHWHGGKYVRAGTRISGDRYGYRCGWVATLEVNPPEWLRDLIDAMSEAMDDAAEAFEN